ncbi:hypothetical protein CN97_08485 [Haematobacter massiliensis]|uniref:FAD-binding domain-containing protein n=1 Tax=Haematobacter massiliensis TaxID=195105 RepID=A0A086Y9W6_9RHOB|nr:hypothetical protein CN97_08485 [Haematobacter massiliensis]
MKEERMAAQSCVIVGAGPAGMMLGYLLARAGIPVTVVEKHPDFLHDFRGDTIHPSTLEAFADLGLLEDFLKLPHQKAPVLQAEIGGVQTKIADFSRIPARCRFIAFMPQWDFLDFLAGRAAAFPDFRLMMGVEVAGLVQSGGQIRGIRIREGGVEHELPADLVIGADGRNSVTRRDAALPVTDFGSQVDVLWLRLSRQEGDPVLAMSHAGPQQGLVLIDRGDYWQCGYVIRKGSYDDLKARGLPAFRESLAALAPLAPERFEEIQGWDQVHLLSVRMDRLERWWRPGLLCIGDAAHAMSPIGGFGVNLAVQDAIAAANILAAPLGSGRMGPDDLARVERRRRFPTRATQKLQLMMRRKRPVVGEANAAVSQEKPSGPPKFLRVIGRWPVLSHLAGRLIGLGFRPERVRI